MEEEDTGVETDDENRSNNRVFYGEEETLVRHRRMNEDLNLNGFNVTVFGNHWTSGTIFCNTVLPTTASNFSN